MPAPDAPTGTLEEIERWNHELDSPFRPPHEIAELGGPDTWLEAGETYEAYEAAYAGEQEAAPTRPTLRRGSRGSAVRDLQQALIRSGAQVTADGNFGPATEVAVRAFQAANGLSADGVVGPRTWVMLEPQAAGIGATATIGGGAPAPAPTPSGDVSADVPTEPLGTLRLEAPGRSFTYPFTRQDLFWTAKLVVYEAGGREDAESAAVLWAMFNHYAFFRHRQYPTFASFIRQYSTTLQPVLNNWRAAERHYQNPSSGFVRMSGFYAKAPHIPRGQLQRHLDIQRAPWSSIRQSARRLAMRALRGELPNPGIGNANEFVSTRILYYHAQKPKRYPTPDQWRAFTQQFRRTKLRWIGDVTNLDQTKNAFFVTLTIADVPAGAVRIDPSAAAGGGASREAYENGLAEATDAIGQEAVEAFEESEDDLEWLEEDLVDTEEGEDETFYEAFEPEGRHGADGELAAETEDEAIYSEAALDTEGAVDTEAPLFEEEVLLFEEEVPRNSRPYIQWVQQSLNRILGVSLTVDGLAGRQTQDAVRRFQGVSGLTADGVVGANTERAMMAAGASPPPEATATPPGPASPATSPAAVTSGGTTRSSQWIRERWQGHHCSDGRMRKVRVQGWNTPVNAIAADAYVAFDRALQQSAYSAERAWSYVCRTIRGSAKPSLHSYGLAIDVDASCNPHRKGQAGPARFSSGATKEDRCRDVRGRRADTVFTPDQVAAVEAIRTVDGLRVFNWGGRWSRDPDAMHFQINVSPAELSRGIAPTP